MLRVEVVNAMSVEEVEKRAALLRPATGEGQQAAAELEQRMLEAEMVDVGCVAECGGLLKDDDMAVDIGQIEGEACDLDQKVAEIALEEDGVVDVDMEIAEMAVDVAGDRVLTLLFACLLANVDLTGLPEHFPPHRGVFFVYCAPY